MDTPHRTHRTKQPRWASVPVSHRSSTRIVGVDRSDIPLLSLLLLFTLPEYGIRSPQAVVAGSNFPDGGSRGLGARPLGAKYEQLPCNSGITADSLTIQPFWKCPKTSNRKNKAWQPAENIQSTEYRALIPCSVSLLRTLYSYLYSYSSRTRTHSAPRPREIKRLLHVRLCAGPSYESAFRFTTLVRCHLPAETRR